MSNFPEWVDDLTKDLPPLCKSKDLQDLFDVSRKTIYNWSMKGKLIALRTPSIGDGKGRLLFPRTEVARLLVTMHGDV